MNDSISREEVLRAIITAGEVESDLGYTHLYKVIENLPSTEPEIIYCKDCRHNGSFDTDCPINWNGKEYCSFAER